MSADKGEGRKKPLEILGKPWQCAASDPKGKRRFDSYDPARFGGPIPSLSDDDIDRLLSASDAFVLKSPERVELREELTSHLTNFQTLRYDSERPSTSEYRERLKSVETAACRLLTTLDISAEPADLWDRGVYSFELNPNIHSSLVAGAGGDPQLVISAITAVAELAHWANRAQPSTRDKKSCDFARIFTMQNLAVTYARITEAKPAATRGGPWLAFLRTFFELAGEHPNTLTDDAIKNAWQQAKALPSMPKLSE